jgi:DNA polymerase-3 subunit delta'
MHSQPVLGHHDTFLRLRTAAKDDQLFHAYLFEGPQGIGKATVALEVAKFANCTQRRGEHACGSCNACQLITRGTHPDVIVVEPSTETATPTITIAQIRELVRQSSYHRYSGDHRFCIVDPAEAMGAPAASALLKTLEEPGPATTFILITANSGALLSTIVSRCQRVRFGPVPQEELTSWLRARVDPQRAEQAARLSLGCPGRALLLAQEEIDKRNQMRDELIATIKADLDTLYGWSTRLCRGQRRAWHDNVEQVFELIEELLRDITVLSSNSNLPLLHQDIDPLLHSWSKRLGHKGVARCSRAIVEGREQLSANVAGRTLLETLIARLKIELGFA